jgi:hypothetical protein
MVFKTLKVLKLVGLAFAAMVGFITMCIGIFIGLVHILPE